MPPGCPSDYLVSLMERRRQPDLVRSLGETMLVLFWNGTSEDRETARTELAASLVEAGSSQAEVRFEDEPST